MGLNSQKSQFRAARPAWSGGGDPLTYGAVNLYTNLPQILLCDLNYACTKWDYKKPVYSSNDYKAGGKQKFHHLSRLEDKFLSSSPIKLE